jgi:hypothetical protein
MNIRLPSAKLIVVWRSPIQLICFLSAEYRFKFDLAYIGDCRLNFLLMELNLG